MEIMAYLFLKWVNEIWMTWIIKETEDKLLKIMTIVLSLKTTVRKITSDPKK